MNAFKKRLLMAVLTVSATGNLVLCSSDNRRPANIQFKSRYAIVSGLLGAVAAAVMFEMSKNFSIRYPLLMVLGGCVMYDGLELVTTEAEEPAEYDNFDYSVSDHRHKDMIKKACDHKKH